MRHVTCVITLAVLSVLCGLAQAAEEAQPANPAEKLLRSVADHYASIKACNGSLTLTISITQGEQANTRVIKAAFALERPNKARVVFATESDSLTVISNGTDVWTYLPTTKKYTQEAAPADLAAFFQQPLPDRIMMGMTQVSFFLFGPTPYESLTAHVSGAEMAAPEMVDGRLANHVVLHMAQADMEVWVDPKTLDIVRARLDVTRAMMAANPDIKPGSMAYVIEVAEQISPVESLPASTWAFAPPEGVQLVPTIDELLASGPSMLGQPIIDFKLEGLQKGTPLDTAQYKGQVIALDFWATWCEPCKEELPRLTEIYADYRARGFVLIGVNVGENREKVAEFLSERKLDFPVALDAKGETAAAYNATGFPMLFLIGRDGIIRHTHRGYGPGMEVEVRQQVEALLAEQAPAP